MNTGKAKKLRREERENAKQVVAEFHIKVFADNNVSISGPIGNFFMYRDVMNKAERAILDKVAQQQQQKIVVPTLGNLDAIIQNHSKKIKIEPSGRIK